LQAHYRLATFYAAYIVSINRTIVFVAQPIPRQYRTFATINPETVSALFRFQQADLPRLIMFDLQIPAEFKLDNGSRVNGQEGVLILLRFFAYPHRLLDLEEYFGWELTRLSRIYCCLKVKPGSLHFDAKKNLCYTKVGFVYYVCMTGLQFP
jgi:hypothetical protein